MATLCVYVFPKSAGIQCLAQATHGYYCAAHDVVVHGPKPKTTKKRPGDRDRDLLPFTPAELMGLAELHEKTRV
jgi:hypothetical protein